MATRPACHDDVSSWLEFLPEVEPLFGSMPEFETHLRRAIDRGTAIVVTDRAEVAGAALLGRGGPPHRIHWLAVRRSHRRQGVAGALVTAMLDKWPAGDVEVVTFTADTPGGEPARRLYEKFGFVYSGETESAPDGGPRDLFVLHRDP